MNHYLGGRVRSGLLCILFGIVGTARLEAQWRVGLGLAKESAHGFSRELGAPDASFVPYRPLVWMLRAESPGARARAALDLRYSSPDLALSDPEATVVLHDGITTVIGVRPAAVVDLTRLSDHVVVRVEAGPLLEIWSFDGESARLRVSPEGALGIAVDLGGRIAGLVSWTGSVTPTSPFKGTGLEAELEPRTGWRWGLRGALMYRLN